jgi:hypothetical protein
MGATASRGVVKPHEFRESFHFGPIIFRNSSHAVSVPFPICLRYRPHFIRTCGKTLTRKKREDDVAAQQGSGKLSSDTKFFYFLDGIKALLVEDEGVDWNAFEFAHRVILLSEMNANIQSEAKLTIQAVSVNADNL